MESSYPGLKANKLQVRALMEQVLNQNNLNPVNVVDNIITTEQDEHPYKFWYRGNPFSSEPRIAEREAGRVSDNKFYHEIQRQVQPLIPGCVCKTPKTVLPRRCDLFHDYR
jgi:hypothetical protein